jgi:hypothetical protein
MACHGLCVRRIAIWSRLRFMRFPLDLFQTDALLRCLAAADAVWSNHVARGV